MSGQVTAVSLPILGDLTYREIHAFEDGFYVGFRGVEVTAEEEYEQEKHYWRMGWLGGHATARLADHVD